MKVRRRRSWRTPQLPQSKRLQKLIKDINCKKKFGTYNATFWQGIFSNPSVPLSTRNFSTEHAVPSFHLTNPFPFNLHFTSFQVLRNDGARGRLRPFVSTRLSVVRDTGTQNCSSISRLKVSADMDASRRVQASMAPTSSLCDFRGRPIWRASRMIADWWNPRIVRAIRVRPTLSWLAISSKVQCTRCILITSASMEVVIEGGESDVNWKISKGP
jgi:hypothetical protein